MSLVIVAYVILMSPVSAKTLPCPLLSFQNPKAYCFNGMYYKCHYTILQGVHAAIYWAPKAQTEDYYNVEREHKNGAAGSTHQPMTEHRHGTTSCFMKFLLCLQGNEKYRKLMRGDRGELNKINSVSTIDRVSRILFPLSFTVLNILYWLVFTR